MQYASALLVLFMLQGSIVSAQELSGKHVAKINMVGNVEKKLKLYRRFFHKDSLRWAKNADRYWSSQTDSLFKVIRQRERALENKKKSLRDNVSSKIYNKVYKPWARNQGKEQILWLEKNKIKISASSRQMLLNYFEQYFLSATQNDSLLIALKARMPSLQMPKQLSAKAREFQLLNPLKTNNIQSLAKGKLSGIKGVNGIQSLQRKAQEYNGVFNQYSQYGKVLGSADTLKGFAKAEGEKMAMNYLSKTEQYGQVSQLKGYQGELNKIKAIPDQYKGQMQQLQDSAYMKEQAKKKAEEMAMNYIADHPEIMQGVQKKMALLMKKYSVVPNSNDLSTAIKRSSLKGKTFRERLVFAGNFQVLSWEPFTIDLSPSIGYKINRNFVVGAGGNSRQTFSTDTIPRLAPEVLGYKAFVSYDVLRNFFAYGEFDRNSPGVKTEENKSFRIWRNAAFAGIGRKLSIHSKVEMTVLMMYNFLHKPGDPIYPRPFLIKVGFQTSELAMMKRR